MVLLQSVLKMHMEAQDPPELPGSWGELICKQWDVSE